MADQPLLDAATGKALPARGNAPDDIRTHRDRFKDKMSELFDEFVQPRDRKIADLEEKVQELREDGEKRTKQFEQQIVELQRQMQDMPTTSKRKRASRSKQRRSEQRGDIDFEGRDNSMGRLRNGRGGEETMEESGTAQGEDNDGMRDGVDREADRNFSVCFKDTRICSHNCSPSGTSASLKGPKWLETLLNDPSDGFDVDDKLIYQPDFDRPLPKSGGFLLFTDRAGNYGAARDDYAHVTLLTPSSSVAELAYFAAFLSRDSRMRVEVRLMTSQKTEQKDQDKKGQHKKGQQEIDQREKDQQLSLLMLLLRGLDEGIELERTTFASPLPTGFDSNAHFLKVFDKRTTNKADDVPDSFSSVEFKKYCWCRRVYSDEVADMTKCDGCGWRYNECMRGATVTRDRCVATNNICSDCAALPMVPEWYREDKAIRNSCALDGILVALIFAARKNGKFLRMLAGKTDSFSASCHAFLAGKNLVDDRKLVFVQDHFKKTLKKNKANITVKAFHLSGKEAEILELAEEASRIVLKPFACATSRNEQDRSSFTIKNMWKSALHAALVGSLDSRSHSHCAIQVPDNTWMLPIALPEARAVDITALPSSLTVDAVPFSLAGVSLLDGTHYSLVLRDHDAFVVYDCQPSQPDHPLLRRVPNLEEFPGRPETAFYFRNQ